VSQRPQAIELACSEGGKVRVRQQDLARAGRDEQLCGALDPTMDGLDVA
jgi:hypothetical protein